MDDLFARFHQHHDHLHNQLKELLTDMATFAEDLTTLATSISSVIADDQAKTAQIVDLTTQLAAANATIAATDPNAASELAAAQAQIEELTTQLNALLPPPVVALALADQTFNGTVGTALTASVAVSGGTAPYSFTQTGLDGDLSLDSTGNLSGTPTAAGTTTASVTVTDSTGATAPGTLTIVVA